MKAQMPLATPDKSRFAALGIAGLALALSACSSAADTSTGPTVADLTDAGTITIGTTFDQPGFGFLNPVTDELEGFDVEIGKIIAADMGISPEDITWVEIGSATREDMIEDGSVDLVIATFTINDERKEVISFAGPYLMAGQDLMVPRGNPAGIAGPEDLADKAVCSIGDSTSNENIQQNSPEAQLILLDDYSSCAQALKAGQVDAVTSDDVVLYGFVASEPGAFEVVGSPFSEEPYGIGLQRDNSELRDFIDDTLEDSYADGSWLAAWDATAGQFMPTPEPPDVDRY
jgi:glutamate transport system substrate-binding protein